MIVLFVNNIKFWGAGHPEYSDSYKAFWEHAEYMGVSDYLVTIRGEIGYVLRNLKGKFGMVYIDGGHVIEQVIPNALWAWNNVVEGGFIVFDDYDVNGTHKWKDVKICVDALLVKWNRKIHKQGALMVAIKK